MLKMKSVIAAVGLSVLAATSWAADITGAGATFPYPMYAKWAEAYKAATGTGLNYQSIGSSGGLKQIRAKTVTFGASDAPVSGADLEKDGMVQFPAIIGGTVPVVNLEGFKPGELRVTGPLLAEMFMGKISKWNGASPAEVADRLRALAGSGRFPGGAVVCDVVLKALRREAARLPAAPTTVRVPELPVSATKPAQKAFPEDEDEPADGLGDPAEMDEFGTGDDDTPDEADPGAATKPTPAAFAQVAQLGSDLLAAIDAAQA